MFFIQDETVAKNDIIKDIIGSKSFSDIVVKHESLGGKLETFVKSIFPEIQFQKAESIFEFEKLALDHLERNISDEPVIHFFSNWIVVDEISVKLNLKKISFIDKPYVLKNQSKNVAILFPGTQSYKSFLQIALCPEMRSTVNASNHIIDTINLEGVIDISIVDNFIQCLTGAFEARFFNNLDSDNLIITKSSTDKNKIRAEYSFYHLLPEDMQFWFVEPFNYVDKGETACYSMEHLHIPNLAIKWVHGSIAENEFDFILDRYFRFFNSRHKKPISREEYQSASDKLYKDKVVSRIESLKATPQFSKMSTMLSANGTDLDSIVNKYFRLKDKLEKDARFEYISAIGHGDPCFANTLYNKSTQMMKLIDPKGAMTPDELWMDPYYDIAKLSHSVCGLYDYFNSGLYSITITEDFKTTLCIKFDNTKYIDAFRREVEKNGYNYWLVRLYEVSLFLSMLPLHIDQPHKVYGFILNAEKTLMEIEKNV